MYINTVRGRTQGDIYTPCDIAQVLCTLRYNSYDIYYEIYTHIYIVRLRYNSCYDIYCEIYIHIYIYREVEHKVIFINRAI